MKPLTGTDRCHAHSLTPEARKELSQRAAKESARVRKERAQARAHALEEARIEARLGVDHWIAVEADKHDQEIAGALVRRALANPDGRAMTMLLERRLGRVLDRLEISNSDKTPEQMSAEELSAWLAGSLDQLPSTD